VDVRVRVEPLDEKLLASNRNNAIQLRQAIEDIKADPGLHNMLLQIAVFSLPEEDGKARQCRQTLCNYYGRTPDIDGLVFSLAHAVDNSEEYLAVQYLPDLVVAGRWDAWQDECQKKAAELRERRKQRAAG
jgi:hypothetical protein